MTIRRLWRGTGGAISRWWNHVVLGGEPGEPASARAHIEWPKTAQRINLFFPLEADHCRESARRHLERAYRTIARYEGKI